VVKYQRVGKLVKKGSEETQERKARKKEAMANEQLVKIEDTDAAAAATASAGQAQFLDFDASPANKRAKLDPPSS
jgi:hypothetical protein